MSKVTPEEYGPENPRDWDTNSPLLASTKAPHETAAVLRMHRGGTKAVDIMKTLRLRGTYLMEALQSAMDQESNAAEAGLDIHDALVKRGTV